jgi:hypothetical protein
MENVTFSNVDGHKKHGSVNQGHKSDGQDLSVGGLVGTVELQSCQLTTFGRFDKDARKYQLSPS